MIFYDLETLKRDINQNNLYDFTELTFTNVTNIPLLTHTVDPENEMRIDNISDIIYKSTDYSDFLLNLNDIDNPLNIKTGDIIKYVDISQLDSYKIATNDSVVTQKTLLNINKSTKKDSNRKQYVEENYALPPTFLETPTESVKIESGKIIIGNTK